MALIFADSCQHYASGDITEKWTGGEGGILTSGPFPGDRCIEVGVQGLGLAVNNQDILTLHTWFYLPGTGTLVVFRDGIYAQVQINIPDNRIQILRGGTVIDQTPPGVISFNVWHHLGFKVRIHNTLGYYYLYLDGKLILSRTNVDTQDTGNAQITYIVFPRNHYRITHIYLCDATGSYNNDYMGKIRSVCLFANAEGTNNGWIPSSGTQRHTMINETVPNDDASYVYTNTVNDTFTCNFSDTSLGGTVIAVQVCLSARTDDAQTTGISPVVRQDGADYIGTEFAVAANYRYYRQVYDTSPAGAAWTTSIINNCEFGARKTT